MATGKIHTPKGLKKWYLADGLTESDVVAAYQFIGRDSWDDAKININDGTQYTLTGTNILFSPVSGLIIPSGSSNGVAYKIDNSTLRGLTIKAVVYGITCLDYGNSYAPVVCISNSKWLGIYSSVIINSSSGGYMGNKGILGGNFDSSQAYFNGAKLSMSSGASPYRNNQAIMGRGANDLGSQKGGIVPALVFYSKELSDAQHAEIAQNISDLSGII